MARIWNKHKQTNTPLKRKVFVAMSGGVDSSVAALLLQRTGYDVSGIYMKEWAPPGIACEAGSDCVMAARVAAHLHIPFEVWDFRKEYKKRVADYMLKEYKAGRTPNPDVMCNKHIKFGFFLKRALSRGADFVATGHYIRLKSEFPISNFQFSNKSQIPSSKFQILTAKDLHKDQSYFLWTLTQAQLKHCLFPIGEYEKPEVRKIAKRARLPSWDKKDSQGVCFVGKLDFADFLRKYLPQKEGNIVTTDGTKIGMHDGVWFYTIGQRHGLKAQNVKHKPQSVEKEIKPLYVVDKNIKKNILVVAEETAPELYKKELFATNTHLVSGVAQEFPLKCKARIRYRQPLQSCILVLLKAKSHKLKAVFAKPQRAVTPGQSVVFYSARNLPAGRQVLGGGIIAR